MTTENVTLSWSEVFKQVSEERKAVDQKWADTLGRPFKEMFIRDIWHGFWLIEKDGEPCVMFSSLAKGHVANLSQCKYYSREFINALDETLGSKQ